MRCLSFKRKNSRFLKVAELLLNLTGKGDTGQGLADTAVAGLAKALGRSRKRAERKVAGKVTEGLDAQPIGEPNKYERSGTAKALANGDGASGPPPPGPYPPPPAWPSCDLHCLAEIHQAVYA
jgi:hypothetical protein